MSGCDHLNPAQFGQPCDDSDETDDEKKRRARDEAREASKDRHPSRTAPLDGASS